MIALCKLFLGNEIFLFVPLQFSPQKKRFFLKADGTIVVWGDPQYPIKCPLPVWDTSVSISKLYDGQYHLLGLTTDGKVKGWGDNSADQLNIPSDLENVVDLAVGFHHSDVRQREVKLKIARVFLDLALT